MNFDKVFDVDGFAFYSKVTDFRIVFMEQDGGDSALPRNLTRINNMFTAH